MSQNMKLILEIVYPASSVPTSNHIRHLLQNSSEKYNQGEAEIMKQATEYGLTKESVGGSISIFMFRLLFPCLLRLLANINGQPRTYHPTKPTQRNNKTSIIV